MTRAPIVAGAAIAALALAASAGAERVKRLDLADYPVVQVTVVTSSTASAPTSLRENGRPVQGLTVSRLQARSVVLAIDRSHSMGGQSLDHATAAARQFVAAKPEDDRIALVSFGTDVDQLTSFSTSEIDVDAGLRTLGADGPPGTTLNDAVVTASNMLATQPRPRLLVLLTDGTDYRSSATFEDATAAARKAGVAVYAIGISGPQFRPGPLRTLAARTGGSFFQASSPADLRRAYAAVSNEFQRTWQLQYYTARSPGDRLRLAVNVPGEGLVTSVAKIPAGVAPGPPHPTSSRSGLTSHWWGALILGLVVGSIVFAAVRVIRWRPKSVWLQERLGPWVATQGAPSRADNRVRRGLRTGILDATESSLGELGTWRALAHKVERAGIPMRTAEVFYLMILSAFVVALVGAIGAASPIVIVILFVLGGLLPYFAVSVKASRRLRAFEAQLPAALNMLAGSLKAGHSFRQALQTLVDEGGPPIDAEFGRVLAEARLGRPMDAALTDMGHRVQSKELDFALRAVIVQRQVGGSLAGLFELVAETLAQRQQFKRKVKSITASGRLSAMILVALPFFVGALITAVSPGYLNPLFDTTSGQVMLGIALGMMTVGAFVLRRMVSFQGFR